MPRTLKYRFWQWALKTAKEKLKECVNADWKCPNCNRWTSEVDAGSIVDDGKYDAIMTCGGCSHKSKWDVGRYPVSVLYKDWKPTIGKVDATCK